MSALQLAERIEEMRKHGSSLIMNWGEDPTPIWEVDWITGGKRFCAFHTDLDIALRDAHLKGVKYFTPLP